MADETATIRVRHPGGDWPRISVRGHALIADQPLEGGGEDTAPTPTELFLASLAGCVAFYAERYLCRHGLPTEGLVVACDYAWARDPARVGQIDLKVEAPGLTSDRYAASRESSSAAPSTAHSCSRRKCASMWSQRRK